MTTLIKNGTLYDGSGEPPSRVDVLLQGDRILRTGTLGTIRADTIIDAVGCTITPGFIDIHTHLDHYGTLFNRSTHHEYCARGITTVIGGNDGISLAPLFHESALKLFEMWGGTPGTNYTWKSIDELLRFAMRQKLGINFGTLVGHSTLRTAFTKGKQRDCTDAEEKGCAVMMRDAFRHGAFGVSYGLQERHASGIPYRELRDSIHHPSFRNKVFVFSPRERNPAFIQKSFEELFLLGSTTHANLEITHIPFGKDWYEACEKMLRAITQTTTATNIHFDIPITSKEEIPLSSLFQQSLEYKNISPHHIKEALLEQFQVFRKTSPIIGHMRETMLRPLEGKTFHDIAVSRHMRIPHAMLEFLRMSESKGTCFMQGDLATHHMLMMSPRSILGSYTMDTFFQFLKNIFNENVTKKTFSYGAPEHMIAKMTSLPAQKYNIHKRGKIREGYFADIVIFQNGEVKDCFVNGARVIEKGKQQSLHSGYVLRSAYTP